MHLELNSTHFWAMALGFGLGVVLFLISLRSYWRTSREFKRYKSMLSDKLEIEQKQMGELSKERTRLLKENENLRAKVIQLNERSDNKLVRDLEVYARAEKQMKINAPGFAGAWELAKETAQSQITDEERGSSLPQRIFRRLLGGGAPPPQPMTVETPSKNGTTVDS